MKTQEELNQLKEDYQKLTKQAQELSDEELQNVIGGCQTYSDATYNSLGTWLDTQNVEGFNNRPLIVTIWNSFKLTKGGSVCFTCDYLFYY